MKWGGISQNAPCGPGLLKLMGVPDQCMPKWRVTVAHHSYTVAEDGFGPARKSLGTPEVRCTCLKMGPTVADDNLDGMVCHIIFTLYPRLIYPANGCQPFKILYSR